MSETLTERPAVEGWYAEDEPRLLGLRCPACGTVVFPPSAVGCPNPRCGQAELESMRLSRQGRVWSYATNHYAPPAPYVSPEPFEPYTVAAVELEEEGITVLGQMTGDLDGLAVGSPVELVIETLFEDPEAGERHLVHKWRLVREQQDDQAVRREASK